MEGGPELTDGYRGRESAVQLGKGQVLVGDCKGKEDLRLLTTSASFYLYPYFITITVLSNRTFCDDGNVSYLH